MRRVVISLSGLNLLLLSALAFFSIVFFGNQREAHGRLEEKYDVLDERLHTLNKPVTINKNVIQVGAFKYYSSNVMFNNNVPDMFPVRANEENKITELLGMRLNRFTGVPEPHNGIDVVTEWRGEVLATMDGFVVDITFTPINGLTVVIYNSYTGYFTLYAHLHEVYLGKIGEEVMKGQVIGRQGGTGVVTGDHVHYEIYYESISDFNKMVEINKVYEDPLHMIKGFWNENSNRY